MPDGTSITIEDEDGYMTLREWYEENQSEEEPALQYPVDIVYETDEGDITVTINNEQEMITFREECEDDENGRPRLFNCLIQIKFQYFWDFIF